MTEEQKNALTIAVRCVCRVWDILEDFDRTSPECKQLDDVVAIIEDWIKEGEK